MLVMEVILRCWRGPSDGSFRGGSSVEAPFEEAPLRNLRLLDQVMLLEVMQAMEAVQAMEVKASRQTLSPGSMPRRPR